MAEPITVGIDLGTTHTVLAYAEQGGAPQVLPLPQAVGAAELDALPLLPSYLYAPLPNEAVVDRWNDAPWTLGTHARRRGQEVPSRLVASAKSWLGHNAVDRQAAILPWGADASETPKLSPLEASQRLLAHVQRVWDAAFPERPLAQQRVVLTVPASFDEAARELTVIAAERAGLQIRLLEEPQAAFYDYMERAGSGELERLLGPERQSALVLVCDVGGGTTDLTLIELRRGAGGDLELERVAVGRHLLLGGDNIDLALAHLCEARLVPPPERLEVGRFSQLVLACRAAKERLLGKDAPDSVRISVAGSGSSLVGSTLATELGRADVERVVFDGFLPAVARDAAPGRSRAGLVAFGLPYEQDPAITRHVASFFARHSDRSTPDALLLNGGLFRAARAAERLRDVVAAWGDGKVELLEHPDPDLAVARGAVVYGLSLGGRGRRIQGGTAHGFYVGVDAGSERRALCVVPRGAREGERQVAQIRGLSLRVGQPVRFELYTLDSSEVHAPGAIVPLDEERFVRLPPVTTVFDAPGASGEINVALEGELTPIGTVELACVETEPPARRFRLVFDRRAVPAPSERPPSLPPRSQAKLDPRVAAAREAITRVFGKGRSDVKPREIKDLWRELERLLGERRSWTADVNRALFDEVVAGQAGRRRSEDHERVFWMLAGYCLRPGFGHPADKARVQKLVALLEAGIGFPQSTRVWQQFWIAWRRIAAGLDETHQLGLRDLLDPFLAPAELKLKKPKQWKPQAEDEMLELASWLERVPVERRAELGAWLLERTWTQRDPRLWAALGRVGARVPLYASSHHVVAPRNAERWLDHLLRERWHEVPTAARAALLLARVTDDRARDVGEQLRREVRQRLIAAEAPAEWVRAVSEHVPTDAAERAADFADELPVGLKWISDDD
jgi:molecular chaperone DnaK (HSP70)